MKLLLVSNLFPTPYDPQRGVFTLQLVKKLSDYCDVTVVCPLPWFPSWKWLGNGKYAQYSRVPEHYVIEGIEVHSPKYILLPRISENHHASLMALGIGTYLRRLHETRNFDAVNSQWLYPDSVATEKIFKSVGLRHVPTGLGCDVNQDIKQPVKGRRILDMLSNCRAITVVSNSLKSELISHHLDGSRIFVIPNGIDMDLFRPASRLECRNKLGMDSDKPSILYVGRLSEEKSVDTLIEATSLASKSSSRFSVYIVGDGPLGPKLKSMARSLGLENQIHFIDSVPHHEIATWMGAADCFCLPSLREGCPNVVLEALGSGRPVIASRVGAIPDVVTEVSGKLFEPGSAQQLSSLLVEALQTEWSPEEISGTVKHLSWDNAAKNYLHAFEQAIGEQA